MDGDVAKHQFPFQGTGRVRSLRPRITDLFVLATSGDASLLSVIEPPGSGGNREYFFFIDGGGKDRYLKLPEGVSAWEVKANEKLDFPAWDFIRDGTRKSWRDFIPMPKGTVLQPGVTGAALDSGSD